MASSDGHSSGLDTLEVSPFPSCGAASCSPRFGCPRTRSARSRGSLHWIGPRAPSARRGESPPRATRVVIHHVIDGRVPMLPPPAANLGSESWAIVETAAAGLRMNAWRAAFACKSHQKRRAHLRCDALGRLQNLPGSFPRKVCCEAPARR